MMHCIFQAYNIIYGLLFALQTFTQSGTTNEWKSFVVEGRCPNNGGSTFTSYWTTECVDFLRWSYEKWSLTQKNKKFKCKVSSMISWCVSIKYYVTHLFVLLDFKVFICLIGLDWIMVFDATFNNISVISWLSVLVVEETGVPQRKPPKCRKSHQISKF
jgi:hypothetical protein